MRSGRRSTRSATRSMPSWHAGDVRLTQGGEPTFVSIDDREGGEWNTEAMGPTKRLLQRRADGAAAAASTAQGGLLHFGQGKWYPGEQLPRWSLNLYWRKDGEPLWNDPALFADEHDDHGATAATAADVPARGWRCGSASSATTSSRRYEDAWYFLWRERKLPSNVDPFDSRLADPHGAGAAAPGVRARPRRAGRLCAAAGRRRAPAGPLALQPLVPARRALLPDPRRFADRLPAAARFAALGRARRHAVDACARPDAAAAAAAAAARRSATTTPSWHATRRAARRRASASIRRRAACTTSRPATTGAVAPEIATPQTPPAAAAAAAARPATAPRRELQPFESAGFVVRTAISAEPRGRAPLRLHAADGDARGLSRPRRRGRGHGGGDARCRSSSKATSRRATRACRCCGSRPIRA